MNERLNRIKPSASMTLMIKAKEMKKRDSSVIGLAGGEPDFDTPERISLAAIRSLTEGNTHYVVGPGIPELRAAIAKKTPGGKQYYLRRGLHSPYPGRKKCDLPYYKCGFKLRG